MNNATLEHLLQIATPPRDASANATRPRSDAPPFDSLFRQASEPQSRTECSADSAPTNSPPIPASRPSERQSAPQIESTTSQDSAARPDSDYASESTAAGDQQEEAEREELESTDAVVVAVVAVQESTPAAGPTAELAVVEEVEQAIDAAAESNTDSKPKPDGKPTPVEDSLIDVPTTTAGKETPAGESTAVEATAAVQAEAATGEQVEATPKVPLTSPAEAAPATAHETKGRARAAAKNREADTTKDSASGDQPVTEHVVEHADVSAIKEGSADAKPALEANAPEPARVDAEAKPAVARAEATNTEQAATTNSNRDQAPAPVRLAAAVSAPIAANVQQQTQAAATTTNTTAVNTVDATTKTDVTRTKDAALSPFARLERNQTGASRGANGAGQSQSAHHVDPARFVSRVARAIHTAQERGAPLQLRLSPPELGAMRIELSVNQGNLTATIETDNTSARQVLLENLPALRERLAEQNVKIERFDVDVRRDGSGQQNQAAQQQNDQPQQDRTARGQSLRNTTNQTTSDEPAPVRRTITTSSINVIA